MNKTQENSVLDDGTMGPDANLESLGKEVRDLSKKIVLHLKTNSIQPPSFREDSPAFYPKDAECQAARLELLSKLQDLWTLALGPGEYLTSHIIYVSLTDLSKILRGLH